MVMRLRFALHGPRNHRIYHLVAVNQKVRRDGRPAELLGVYDPRLPLGAASKKVEWSVDRIRYWISVGAQPSKTVEKLLVLGGLLKPKPVSSTKFPPPTSTPPRKPLQKQEPLPPVEEKSKWDL
ncbi:ribosomal protein S16 [Flagelloscypha sp. PMI_526]|nr:ribosomal protein S16 [Flagelloscypha sp. PMI_526]